MKNRSILLSLTLAAVVSCHAPNASPRPAQSIFSATQIAGDPLAKGTFEIRGILHGTLSLHSDHTFERLDEIPGSKDQLRTIGHWESVLPDAPILNLVPGGLFYIGFHDAATSATPLTVVDSGAVTDPLLYLKTPKGQIFLPQIAASPGDAPGNITGWRFAMLPLSPFDSFHFPFNSPLMPLVIDYSFNPDFPFNKLPGEPTARFSTISNVGGVIMLGCWGENAEKLFFDRIDVTLVQNYSHTDLLIIRTGYPFYQTELAGQPTRERMQQTYHAIPQFLFKDGPYLYPLFIAEWHRDRTPSKNIAKFTDAKKAFLDLLQSRSVPLPP